MTFSNDTPSYSDATNATYTAYRGIKLADGAGVSIESTSSPDHIARADNNDPLADQDGLVFDTDG